VPIHLLVDYKWYIVTGCVIGRNLIAKSRQCAPDIRRTRRSSYYTKILHRITSLGYSPTHCPTYPTVDIVVRIVPNRTAGISNIRQRDRPGGLAGRPIRRLMTVDCVLLKSVTSLWYCGQRVLSSRGFWHEIFPGFKVRFYCRKHAPIVRGRQHKTHSKSDPRRPNYKNANASRPVLYGRPAIRIEANDPNLT